MLTILFTLKVYKSKWYQASINRRFKNFIDNSLILCLYLLQEGTNANYSATKEKQICFISYSNPPTPSQLYMPHWYIPFARVSRKNCCICLFVCLLRDQNKIICKFVALVNKTKRPGKLNCFPLKVVRRRILTFLISSWNKIPGSTRFSRFCLHSPLPWAKNAYIWGMALEYEKD